MRFGHRIGSIYAKELVEILRDRRTLLAMIVVPIVLYPLLIIGSVHLLSIQDTERKSLPLVIAVPYEPNVDESLQSASIVQSVLKEAERLLRQRASETDDEELEHKIESIEQMSVQSVNDVELAVATGQYRIGLSIEFEEPEDDPNAPGVYVAKPYYDQAEIRSEAALDRVLEVLDVIEKEEQSRLLAYFRTPDYVLDPIRVEPVNVATPRKVGGMVLGTIVPLVLVLMTITGAIYPAIDLTAGERERGTLETLIVCPVPPMELITGKYLVVTTIALLGAALNLLSVGATLYFGGFTEMIGEGKTELPLSVLPVILLALIPFALLFSAVMVAVCSYARTFKEAQNYIMPVILAALIPGGMAALPGTEMVGVKMVVPVMNMVLLARELLLGHWDWGVIALVMLSTSLYAATAVIVASRVFSTEAVVFADSASLKASFSRKVIRPTTYPSITMALIVVAVLFPLWMFVQFSIQPGEGGSLLDLFAWTARIMPLLFVALPLLLMWYWRVNIFRSLSLRPPGLRFVLGGLLIGAAAWIPAHELFMLQSRLIPIPEALLKSDTMMREAFAGHGLWVPILLIAVVPGVCEELFFRGFLLAGLRSAARKWTAIIATACMFAVFHIWLIKFPVTAGLGILLGFLCWQSGSIWPSIIAHVAHNATAALIAFWPVYEQTLGIEELGPMDHFPMHITAAGIVVVAIGLTLILKKGKAWGLGSATGGSAPSALT